MAWRSARWREYPSVLTLAMFCPVTSSARRCDHNAVVAAFRPEKVLTWLPRYGSSASFAGLRRSWGNSHTCSQCAVQGDGAVGAVLGAPAGVAVGARRRRPHLQQGIADRGKTALDELAIGVGEAAQVGHEDEQRLVVLGEQVVPRRRRGVGQ